MAARGSLAAGSQAVASAAKATAPVGRQAGQWGGSGWSGGGGGGGWRGGGQQQSWRQDTLTPGYQQASQAPLVDDDKTFYAFYAAMGNDGGGVTGTLVGTYKEEGVNHGRKYYRKAGQDAEHEVYMYYWDERDGPNLNGWWFGNMVGGRQVWARNADTSPMPPVTGWCIPWDGQARPEFQVAGAAAKRAHDHKVAQEAERKRRDEINKEKRKQQIVVWQQRVNACSEHVQKVENEVGAVLEQAQHCQDGGEPVSAIDAAIAPLKQQMVAAMGAQRILTQEAKQIIQHAPELKEDMSALSVRVRDLQTKVKETGDKLTVARAQKVKEQDAAKAKDAEEARLREMEPVHSQRLQELMEGANASLADAEDEVEKVAIAAAPLEVEAGEELEPVMLEAIAETESRVTTATTVITTFKTQISAGQKESAQFVPSMKQAASEQFDELDTKFKELQERLNVYKNVRKDYNQRAKDKEMLDELSEKVVGVEVQLDQAESMPVESQVDVKEVERTLSTAQTQLKLATDRIEKKFQEISAMAKNVLMEQVSEVHERGQLMHDKLEKMLQQTKDSKVRMVTDTIVADVSEKVKAVEEGVQKMASIALPDAEASEEEVKKTFVESEKVAGSVKTSLAEAHAFLAVKLAESRTSIKEESGREAVAQEIDSLKQKLESQKQALEVFKNALHDSMRSHLLKEVEQHTESAEMEEVKFKEVVAAIDGLCVVGEPMKPDLVTALTSAVEAEKVATQSLVIAHQALVAKTAELKKLIGSATQSGMDLGRYQIKQSTVMKNIVKHQNVVQRTEALIRVKEMLSEVAGRLTVGEAEVDKAQEAVLPLMEEDEPSPESCKKLDTVASSADQKLKTTMKLVDLKLRNSRGELKEELQAMRNRLADADIRLRSYTNGVKEQQERSQVNEIILEVNGKIEEAEGSVQKAGDAHGPLAAGLTGLSDQDLKAALDSFTAVIDEADAAVSAAWDSIATKGEEGKQLSENSAEKTAGELSTMQVRAEEASKKLNELKAHLADHKRSTRAQMMKATISNVTGTVAKLRTLMKKVDTDEKLVAFSDEEAASTQAELAAADQAAQSALSEAKEFVAFQLKEARTLAGQERQTFTKELGDMQSKLTHTQVEAGKLSTQAAGIDQRFAAQKLLKDNATTLEQLQKDVEIAGKLATPFIEAKDKTAINGTVCLDHMVVTIEEYIAAGGELDMKEFFAKLSAGDRATKAELVAFIGTLPQLVGRQDLVFTEKQLDGMFTSIQSEAEDGCFEMSTFRDLFLKRYTCSEITSLWDAAEGGAEIGSLQVGELVRCYAEPEGDALVQCIVAKDGGKAWVAPANSEGGPCLELNSGVAWQLESIDAFVTAIHTRCTEAGQLTDQSMAEVKTIKDGPLAAVKGKLMQQRMRMTAEQAKVLSYKSKIGNLKNGMLQGREKDVKAAQEAKEKELKAAKEAEMKEGVLREVAAATKMLEDVEAQIAGISDGIKGKDLVKDFAATELSSYKKKADEIIAKANESKEVIAKAMKAQEELPSAIRTQLREVRLNCAKLTSRATTAERRCSTAIQPVRVAYEKSVRAALNESKGLFKAAFRRLGQPANQLFDEVADGGMELTESQFEVLVSKLPDSGIAAGQATILFNDLSAQGLNRLQFATIVEEFMVCEKGVVMTKTFDLKDAELIRKVEVGELLEVLEGPNDDSESGMKRVRGRLIRDSVTGWISVVGNKGSAMMKPADKPTMVCTLDAALVESFDDKSPEVAKITVEEVVELLEGPKEASQATETWVKGVASKDKAAGWILVTDSAGVAHASTSDAFYKCKAATALTDSPDIQKCKPLRKIEVGEVLEVTKPDNTDDLPPEAQRIYVRAAKDGKMGWATIQGTRGTTFLEPEAQYKVVKASPLKPDLKPGSKMVRQIEEGEVFKPEGEPKEHRPPTNVGIQVRKADNTMGWVVHSSGHCPPLDMRVSE